MGAIVPTVVDAVDVDALIGELDIDALMARVDIDELLTRIDIDALLTRIDIDALLGRIDVSALIARIDMNAVIGQVDLNALLDDVDIKAIVAKAGIDEIVAEASTGIIARTLDLARRQLVGVDIIILGAIDRLFRRKRQPLPQSAKLSATGRPAGPVSRLVAFGVDLFLVSAIFSIVVYFGKSLLELFTGDLFHPTSGAGLAWIIGYFSWFGLYLWGSIEIAGRTPGKALVGLRVVALDGTPLGPVKALWRTLAFPFSFILGLGFIPGVTRKDRRALHELVSSCHEIVDWGDREAGVPSALEGWVARQRMAQLDAAIAIAQADTAPAGVAATATTAVPAIGAPVVDAPAVDTVEETVVLDVHLQAEPAPDAVVVSVEADAEASEGAEAPAAADEEPVVAPTEAAAMASSPVLTEPVSADELVVEPSDDDGGDSDYWAANS